MIKIEQLGPLAAYNRKELVSRIIALNSQKYSPKKTEFDDQLDSLYFGRADLNIDGLLESALEQAELRFFEKKGDDFKIEHIMHSFCGDSMPRRSSKNDRRSRFMRHVSPHNKTEFHPKFFNYWEKHYTRFAHFAETIGSGNDEEITGVSIYLILTDIRDEYIFTGGSDGIIKIFYLNTGMLFRSLIGHENEISILTISENRKYIASVDSNGIIRIWKFPEGTPLAVLTEGKGKEINSMVFFELENIKKQPGEVVLLVCVPGHAINLYKEIDFSNNEGIAIKRQKYLNLIAPILQLNPSEKITFADINAQGTIAAHAKSGTIYIWPSIYELQKKSSRLGLVAPSIQIQGVPTMTKSEIELNWSNSGRYMTNSCSQQVLLFEAGKNKEVFFHKITIKAQSSKSKHKLRVKYINSIVSMNDHWLIVGFNYKYRDSIMNDEEVFEAEIALYNLEIGKVIHVISHGRTSVPMNSTINALQFHPIIPNVFATVDMAGYCIIWDASVGAALQIFKENASHLKSQLMSPPAWDCKFSHSGSKLLVSTGLGTFSMYGYGEVPQATLNVEIQQFSTREYIPWLLEKSNFQVITTEGREFYTNTVHLICNAKGEIYTYNHSFNLMGEGNNCDMQTLKSDLAVFEAAEANSIRDLKPIQRQERIRGQIVKDRVLKQLMMPNIMSSAKSEDDSISNLDLGRGVTTTEFSPLPNDQESRTPQNRYVEDSFMTSSEANENLEGGDDDSHSSGSSFTIPAVEPEVVRERPRRSRQQSQYRTRSTLMNLTENNTQLGKRSIEILMREDEFEDDRSAKKHKIPEFKSGVCSRCKIEVDDAYVCQNEHCGRLFHVDICSELRMGRRCVQSTKKFCFECIAKTANQTKSIRFPWTEHSIDMWQHQLDTPEETLAPQLGDVYYFIPLQYERYVSERFVFLGFNEEDQIWPQDTISGFGDLEKGYKCIVKHIEYVFPHISEKIIRKKEFHQVKVVAVLRLMLMEGNMSCLSVRYNGFDFKNNFLIFEDLYDQSIEGINGKWERNGYIDQDNGFRLYYELDRNSTPLYGFIVNEQNINQIKPTDSIPLSSFIKRFPIWNLQCDGDTKILIQSSEDLHNILRKPTFKKGFSKLNSINAQGTIDSILSNEDLQFTHNFIEDVNIHMYKDYLEIVPRQINLSRIMLKLEREVYRTLSSLEFDLSQIEQNCILYNQANSFIAINAALTSEYTKKALMNDKSSMKKILKQVTDNQMLEIRRDHLSPITEHSSEDQDSDSFLNKDSYGNPEKKKIKNKKKEPNSRLKRLSQLKMIIRRAEEFCDSESDEPQEIQKKPFKSIIKTRTNSKPNKKNTLIVDDDKPRKKIDLRSSNKKLVRSCPGRRLKRIADTRKSN